MARLLPLLVLALLLTTGCASPISRQTSSLAAAVKDSNDLATVKAGLPAYLIMLDALVADAPDNAQLLRVSADLNGSYGAVFAQDPDQAKLLADKSLALAHRACCAHNKNLCNLAGLEFPRFQAAIGGISGEEEIPYIFSLGAAWLAWIEANRDDLRALAQLSQVESIMKRIVAMDEQFQGGSAHLYLGSLAIMLPPALGGRPQEAKAHFERAIAIGGDMNLRAKVVYADKYGRMMFDRALHDRLLTEVLAADPKVKGFTLSNVLAQREARELLNSSPDYF
ncbi:MAG: TRAP transporter TatT component family protein [Thermodesulfobacteriota bacterium]